jgi:hypothetical protein
MTEMNASDSMATSSSQVLERLRQNKMDNEFKWTPEGFTIGRGKTYQPQDLEILKAFRFEGASNPSDMEILYVIRAKDGLIGYSQDAYGMYSSHEKEEGYDNFIRQIPEAGHDSIADAGHDQQLPFEL